MERRGSEVLREKYKSGGFVLDDGMIDELAGVVDEFVLRDVFVKGIPHPDFVRLTVDVDDAEHCGTVVNRIAGLLGRSGTAGIPAVVRIFPKGIPWPEAFSVRLDLGSR